MRSTVTSSSILLGLLAGASCLSYNGELKASSIQDFPYFASVEVNGHYACAATIVDDKYVMTTYSCVQGIDVASLGVRAGASKQGQRGVYFKVVDVSSWHGNPYVGPSPQVDYDIAMVKVPITEYPKQKDETLLFTYVGWWKLQNYQRTVAVSFSYTPQVMWANPNADGIQEFQEGSLVGWADPKQWGGPLISAKAYVMPSSNCSQIYAGVMNISADMYCLWPSDPANTPCFADMGAPFYLNEQYYGIVTHAPGCDKPSLPIVVTGIAKFTSFIIMVLCDMKDIFGASFQDGLQTFAASEYSKQELFPARQSL